jgi:hypothetical protein
MTTREGLTDDERALLGQTLNAREREIEVVVEDGKATERYLAARQLERDGLLTWLSCTGSMSGGHRRIRVRYTLTPHGELVARGSLS